MTTRPTEEQLTNYISRDFITCEMEVIRKYGANVATFLGIIRRKTNYWKKVDKLTEDGFFYISIRKINEITNFSASTISRIIKTLTDAGILEVKLLPVNNNKFKKVNHYKINATNYVLISGLVGAVKMNQPSSQKRQHLPSRVGIPSRGGSPSSSFPSPLLRKGKEKGRTTEFAEKRANSGDIKPSSKKRSRRIFKRLDRDKLIPVVKPNLLLDYWNSKSPVVTKHKKGSSKTYGNSIILLARTLKRHSTREIRSRIDNYCDLLVASENGGLWINNKSKGVKVSLPHFLKEGNTHTYNAKLKLKGGTWFEECSKPAPELIEKFSLKLKDKNPIYTHHIKSQWENKGLSKGRDLTVFDENNFIEREVLTYIT